MPQEVLDRITSPAVPRLEEQARIATVLNALRTAMLTQRRLVETTQALKRAAMQTLFTRGLRGEPQKETEIGPVPESWEVVEFSTVRDYLQYGTSVRCTYEPTDRPVLRIPNIDRQFIQTGDLKYCGLDEDVALKYELHQGDILFIRTNGVLERLGSCAVYRGDPAGALFASYLIRAVVNKDLLEPEFVAAFLGSDAGTDAVAGRAIPASDGKFNLNTAAIDSLPIALPPTLDEQREIVAVLDTVDRKIDLHRRKRNVLDELFKLLLHKLMTGEIRVGDLGVPDVLEGVESR